MNGKRMIESGMRMFQGGAVAVAFVVMLPIVVRAERPEFRGDFDGDGQVGPADLAILFGGYDFCGDCPEDLDRDRRVSCPADLDEDGEVGPADLAILLGGWGYCRNCSEDLNGDRGVDEVDLNILIESWGICPSSWSEIQDFCESDFDEDGDVGPADLAMLLGSYGQRDTTVDLNGDGYIDDADVDILLADWGPCESVY